MPLCFPYAAGGQSGIRRVHSWWIMERLSKEQNRERKKSKRVKGKPLSNQNWQDSLDAAMVNSGIIHKTLNKDKALNLKEFERVVTTVYLKKTVIRTISRPRISTVPSYAKEDIRKEGVGHFLLKQEKQRCCQREG
ncbi:hypothetical protein TNCV_4717681 [Trichonephila clavipes]|nr:hypothetical protein TNCV_4717681 [Trichonephila clavipes]